MSDLISETNYFRAGLVGVASAFLLFFLMRRGRRKPKPVTFSLILLAFGCLGAVMALRSWTIPSHIGQWLLVGLLTVVVSAIVPRERKVVPLVCCLFLVVLLGIKEKSLDTNFRMIPIVWAVSITLLFVVILVSLYKHADRRFFALFRGKSE